MSVVAIVCIVLQMISCVSIIAIVLLQSGKSSGLSGTLSGGSETFLSKNKSKSWDVKLAKSTKWLAIVFTILTLVINFIL